MKLNLIAAATVVAVGTMFAGAADAQQRNGHIGEVRELIRAEAANRGLVGTQAIGDLDTGFNPIEPCRIADTRLSVDGPLTATETRNFVIEGDLADQGGNVEGCDIPEGVSSLALNVAAVRPATAGFLTAFPGGTERPLAATVNYDANQIIGNGTLIAVGDGVDVYMHRAGDVIVDVTGYFFELAGSELDCYATFNDGQVAAGGDIFVDFEFCDAGYAAVGGGCDQNSNMPLIATGTFSNDENAHVCVYDNTDGPDAAAFVDVNCCRVQPQGVADPE